MPTHLKLLRHIAALLLAALVSQPTIASAQAPIITVGPVDQIVSAGTAVTFSVTATGTAPLTYQCPDAKYFENVCEFFTT